MQHQLFNLGGELSMPGYTLLKDDAAAALDDALAHYNATLPRLAEFILPAGTRSASLAHVCRTVARRAERAVVALAAERADQRCAAPVPQPAERPAVRAGARAQPRIDGGDDVYWKSERLRAQSRSGRALTRARRAMGCTRARSAHGPCARIVGSRAANDALREGRIHVAG